MEARVFWSFASRKKERFRKQQFEDRNLGMICLHKIFSEYNYFRKSVLATFTKLQ